MGTTFDAGSWLDEWLAAYPWVAGGGQAGAALTREAAVLPKANRVALHRLAVSRLQGLRARADDPHRWEKGSAVYELACDLYGAKLPYTESDICALLTASRHDCGHGQDVKPPFELAVKWARTNGVSPGWLAAVRTFIGELGGLRSAIAHDLKRKGALVLLLDSRHRGASRCYSERFRAELGQLPGIERAAWERLVLHMGTAMSARMPKGFDVQARALAAFLGSAEVLARLDAWLPAPADGSPCRLETAGSHLAKNLVWLLAVLAADPDAAPSCDLLVERLARVDFTPSERGTKVVVACAVYFSQRPPAIADQPLAALLARSLTMEKDAYSGDAIRKIVDAYRSAAVRA